MLLLVPFAFERMLGSLIREAQLLLEQFHHPVGTEADAGLVGQVLGQPFGGPDGKGEAQLARGPHHRLSEEAQVRLVCPGWTSGPRSVVESFDPRLDVAFAPLPDGRLGEPRGPSNLLHGALVGRHQYHDRPSDQATVPGPTPQLLQLPAGSRWQSDSNGCWHDDSPSLGHPAAKYISSWVEPSLRT